MTDEEHYNAMAESMNQDTIAVVSGTGTVEDPLVLEGSAIDDLSAALDEAVSEDEEESGKIVMVDATPESIAKQIVGFYTERFGRP